MVENNYLSLTLLQGEDPRDEVGEPPPPPSPLSFLLLTSLINSLGFWGFLLDELGVVNFSFSWLKSANFASAFFTFAGGVAAGAAAAATPLLSPFLRPLFLLVSIVFVS